MTSCLRSPWIPYYSLYEARGTDCVTYHHKFVERYFDQLLLTSLNKNYMLVLLPKNPLLTNGLAIRRFLVSYGFNRSIFHFDNNYMFSFCGNMLNVTSFFFMKKKKWNHIRYLHSTMIKRFSLVVTMLFFWVIWVELDYH